MRGKKATSQSVFFKKRLNIEQIRNDGQYEFCFLSQYKKWGQELFTETLHHYNRDFNPLSGIFIDEMIKNAYCEEMMKAGQDCSLTLDLWGGGRRLGDHVTPA